MRWIKWDRGKLRRLRLVSARPLSLTYQVTWTHHSPSLDAPPCDALSPGAWVKERQDPPQTSWSRQLHHDTVRHGVEMFGLGLVQNADILGKVSTSCLCHLGGDRFVRPAFRWLER